MGTDWGDPGDERYLDVWRALDGTRGCFDGLRMFPPDALEDE
jgi:hypothetical protein